MKKTESLFTDDFATDHFEYPKIFFGNLCVVFKVKNIEYFYIAQSFSELS
jgi:hypothetical protein